MASATYVTVNGYAVQEIRKLVGLTQRQLADLMDVGVPYVSRIENGLRDQVAADKFARMWRALKVRPAALMASPTEAAEDAA